MLWLDEYKPVWRVALLVLLLVALLGPWWFDRISVPAKYPCSAPVVRLEGDFCGVPMSGTSLLFILVAGSREWAIRWLTGAAVPLDLANALRATLFSIVAPLLMLPFLTSLFLILRGDGRRPQVLHIAAWGLAALAALVVRVNVSRSLWMVELWGSWLYTGVAAAALVLEAAILAAKRALRWRAVQ